MRSTYKICLTWDDIYTLIGYIKTTGVVSHDFETQSEDKRDKKGALKYYSNFSTPSIISLSFQPGSAWVIPLAHPESPFLDEDEWILILKYLGKELFSNPEITKVSWNTKFEYKWFLRYGVEMRGRCFDGMLAKHLLDEERPHGLKEMVEKFLPEFAGYGLKSFDVDMETLSEYGSLDADLTLRLFIFFEGRLMRKGFYPLFRNLFTPLTSLLAKCEYQGINVDTQYLDDLVIKYDNLITEKTLQLRSMSLVSAYDRKRLADKKQRMIDELEDEILSLDSDRQIASRELKIKQYSLNQFITKKDREAMEPINFGSPKQLIDLFYESKRGFRFKIIERTESGAPSTAEATLLKLKEYDDHGFIEALLDLRGLEKLQSTYIRGIQDILNGSSVIHSSYKIHGTVTGRLSSTEPNMQNIPRTCIAQDQKILTHRGWEEIGKYVPLSIGTIELPYLMVKTHTGQWRRALEGVNKGQEEMFEVEFESGEKLVCTQAHKMLTTKGWRSLTDIITEGLTVKAWKQ